MTSQRWHVSGRHYCDFETPSDNPSDYEFPSMIREFLGNFEIKQDLRNLEDIVAWNEGHADRALPAREYEGDDNPTPLANIPQRILPRQSSGHPWRAL